MTKALLQPVDSYGWWPRIFESYPGAWQQNVVVDRASVSAYWAVFACVTMIASDISKLNARVMERNKTTGVLKGTFLRPVLRKPNHFQTSVEFFFFWMVSQLLHGN